MSEKTPDQLDDLGRLADMPEPSVPLLRRMLDDPFFDESAWARAARTRLVEAVDRLEALEAWKEEALMVLGEWEKCWEAAGRPGNLGASKASATADHIAALEARNRERVERQQRSRPPH